MTIGHLGRLTIFTLTALLFAAAAGRANPLKTTPSFEERPRPLIGVNVVPPSATSSNWVFGDLLLQAQFIDGTWHAFSGAGSSGADYPRDGFIIEPADAAKVIDTGDGLLIEAPADARDRGVHVYLPGASPDRLFHPMYLKRLAPFGVLRFAEWMEADESDTPDLRRLAVSILLCNANESSPWYCMGARWSDEDVRRFAGMVRRGLEVDRPIYVEWSNEPWLHGSNDEAALDAWADRAQQVFDIWRDEFSDQPQRIIRVASGPTQQIATTTALAARLGAGGFDALACSAAMSITDDAESLRQLKQRRSAEPDAVVIALFRQLDAAQSSYQKHAALANDYGVPLLAYDAGLRTTLTDDRWADASAAAQHHPDMYTLSLRHANAWLSAQRQAGLAAELIGHAAIVYGRDVAPADSHGSTGQLAFQDQPLARAPMYRAIADLARQPHLAQRAATVVRPEEWTPAPPHRGWTDLIPSLNSRVIYVSSTKGNDRNDGLSPQTPVRTPQRGYELMRDGHADWLLFRRGDTFSMPDRGFDGFRLWRKSGISELEPMVIASYGEPTDPRPLFLTNGNGFMRPGWWDGDVRHLVIADLHAVANYRQPGNSEAVSGDSQETGLFLSARRLQDVRFEGLTLEYFHTNVLVTQSGDMEISDITFRRCVIRNAWTSGSSHTQGFYAASMSGLTLIDCVFDHNGWLEDKHRNWFRQQVYLSDVHDARIEGCVFTRGSFMALKVRGHAANSSANIVIRDNLFFDTLAPIVVGGDQVYADQTAILHKGVTIVGNVFTRIGGGLSNGATFATALSVEQADDVLIEGNYLLHLAEGAPDDRAAMVIANGKPHGDIIVRGNVIHDWFGEPQSADDAVLVTEATPGPARRGDITVLGNQIELAGETYVAPTRSLETYTGSFNDLDGNLIDRLVEQRKYHWDDRLTARAIIQWFREGFKQR